MLPAGTARSSHRPRSTPRLAAAGIAGRSAGPRVASSAHPASADAAAETTNNSEVVEVAVRISRSPNRKVMCSLLSPPYSEYALETRHIPVFIGPAGREEPLAPTLCAAQSWAEAKHLMPAPLARLAEK